MSASQEKLFKLVAGSDATRDQLKRLLTKQQNVIAINEPGPSGNTALELAVLQNSPVKARLLIEAGADVNQAISSNGSLMHIAALYQNSTMALLLLDAGINPESADASGLTVANLVAESFQDIHANLNPLLLQQIQDLTNTIKQPRYQRPRFFSELNRAVSSLDEGEPTATQLPELRH